MFRTWKKEKSVVGIQMCVARLVMDNTLVTWKNKIKC